MRQMLKRIYRSYGLGQLSLVATVTAGLIFGVMYILTPTASVAGISAIDGEAVDFTKTLPYTTEMEDLAGTPIFAGNEGLQGYYYVRCNSVLNRRRTCTINRTGNVRLYRRHSSSGCVRGKDWGIGPRSIWVDNGCQATFRVRR